MRPQIRSIGVPGSHYWNSTHSSIRVVDLKIRIHVRRHSVLRPVFVHDIVNLTLHPFNDGRYIVDSMHPGRSRIGTLPHHLGILLISVILLSQVFFIIIRLVAVFIWVE